MQFTNKFGLPQSFVEAVTNDPYGHDSDISITKLINPPQMAALQNKHDAEIIQDVSERVFSLLGQSVHTLLERTITTDTIVEERFSLPVNGWEVSGQIDLYEKASDHLIDYKVTSAWSVLSSEPPKKEWVSQLNAYAHLLRAAGHTPRSLSILAIVRDWSYAQQRRSDNYPPRSVVERPIPLLPPNQVQSWIEERVQLHQKARAGTWDECTDEERWAKPDTWAVYAGRAKRATRIFDSSEDALTHAQYLSNTEQRTHTVKHRRGSSPRCERYCSVAPFCPQWDAIKKSS